MRNRILIVGLWLGCLVGLASASAPEQEAIRKGHFVVTTQQARVMAEGNVVATVDRDQIFEVQDVQGQWVLVEVDKKLGWIQRNGLRPVAEEDIDRLAERVVQFYHAGRHEEGIQLAQAICSISKVTLGEKHPSYATWLNNLAALYKGMGDYARAEPLYQEALAVRKEVLGEKHPDYAQSLNNLARLYHDMGDYARAEPLLQEALAIRKEALGEKHPHYAASLNNLAGLYDDMGDYARAEPLFQEALAIQKEVLGEKHPKYALSLNNLALLYHKMGDHVRAEPLYQEALAILKEALGEKHPDYANSLNNLAGLYDDMGDYARAEPLYQEALAILKDVLGEKHPLYATSLNNLGLLYQAMGDYARAEPLLQQALAIQKEVLGEKHPDYALSLNNLAGLYEAMGDYARAEPLHQEALAIRKEALGEKHPDYAQSLNNLAGLYHDMGDYARAKPLHQEALAIRKEALGEKHPDYAQSLGNLAALLAIEGRWLDARKAMGEACRVLARHVARVLPGLAEKEQLAFLRAEYEPALHAALSLGLARRKDPEIPATSAEWLLNGKAVASQALAERALLARRLDNPQAAAVLKELMRVRSQLAQHVVQTPKPEEQEQYQARLAELTAREAELSRKLGQATDEEVREDPWVTLDEIQKAIPQKSVLVELARFNVFNFSAKDNQQRWQPPRYAAWIIPAAGGGEVQLVDLGPAAPIDEAINAFRQAIETAAKDIQDQGERDAEAAMRKRLAEIARLVLAPLEPHLGETPHWILSPDASLWLVPWAALPLADGRYAVEKHTLQYLVSGRDLVVR